MIKKIVKWLINLICCHVLYRVKYYNLDKITSIDKCVICPNHSNIFDATFIYPKIDNLCIMAKDGLFKNKMMAKIWRYFDVFPINRGKHDFGSLLHAIRVFDNNADRKLLIYMEGTTIAKNKDKGIAKVGAMFIAAKANVPIVPVYVTKNPRLFSRVNVIFGDKIDVSKAVLDDKAVLKEESVRLLDTIYGLRDTVK